jgi:hydrogenase maturation protein HypF
MRYQDYLSGTNRQTLIVNFIFTLASIVIDFTRLKEIEIVTCSGGVFQNTVLIDMMKEMAGEKIKLYFNRKLAPNDENISYGQIAYYLNSNDPI